MYLGPIEVLGRWPRNSIQCFNSLDGGIIVSLRKSSRNPSSIWVAFRNYILLIPGGLGVRDLLKNDHLWTRCWIIKAQSILWLSALVQYCFQKRVLLDGRKATSNKRLFSWAQKESPMFGGLKSLVGFVMGISIQVQESVLELIWLLVSYQIYSDMK